MQKRVSSPVMRLVSSLISTGEGGGSVVLFVSPSSFIDIQNRYLLNVERENMTVGGVTKEPRERPSRYATGVLVFSTEEEKRDTEK